MADKEKKVANDSEVEKATTEESKAAEKVAKAAKGNKKNNPGFAARVNKGSKRFFKDFKGECKKIVWPDARTVLKNTGVVLVVVTIVTIAVFAIDFGLERGVSGLKGLAKSATDAQETTVSEVVETTVADAKESEEASEKEAEAETEKATETEEATEAEATEE